MSRASDTSRWAIAEVVSACHSWLELFYSSCCASLPRFSFLRLEALAFLSWAWCSSPCPPRVCGVMPTDPADHVRSHHRSLHDETHVPGAVCVRVDSRWPSIFPWAV